MFGYGFGTGFGAMMNSVASYQYLLDLVSNGYLAFDLRKVRSAYSGNCIRVRRSSDNTEQDIGFVSNVLDTASLLTFCGAGSGYVVTWYDQSTNSINLTQSNASSQPRIVSSGVLDTKNSKATVIFSGAQRLYTSSVTLFNPPFQAFVVGNANNFINTPYFFDTDSRALMYFPGEFGIYNGTGLLSGNSTFTFKLHNGLYDSTNGVIRLNGAQVATGATGSGGFSGVVSMGTRFSADQYLTGSISTMILFNANKSSDNSTIETNINTYYGTY